VTCTARPQLEISGTPGIAVNEDLDRTAVPVLRRLSVRALAFPSALVAEATAPLRLELPPDIETVLPRDPGLCTTGYAPMDAPLTLRIRATLSDLVADLPEEPNLGGGRFEIAGRVSGRVTFESVALIIPAAPNAGRAEQVVTEWRPGEAAPSAPGPDPATPEGVAALYGGAAEEGRLSVTDVLSDPAPALLDPRGSGEGRAAAETVLRLAAVMAAEPDRPLSDEMLTAAALAALAPEERDAITPGLTVQPSLEAILALRAAEPALRKAVGDRAVRLPLAVRHTIMASIGEYDTGARAFPMYFGDDFRWLSGGPSGRPDPGLYADALPMTEAEAVALIDSLAKDTIRGDVLPLSIDYTYTAAAVLGAGAGPVTPEDLARVRIDIRHERLTVWRDAERTEVLFRQDFAPAAPAAIAQVPDEVHATTAETLIAAVDALAGDPGYLPALGIADPQSFRGLRRESYWIGARLTVEAHDPARGGFPLRQAVIDPAPYVVQTSTLAAPGIVFADAGDFAVLPATAEEAALIQPHVQQDGRLFVLLRVTPVAAMADPLEATLVVGPPAEIFIGPHGNAAPEAAPVRYVPAGPLRIGARPDLAAASPDRLLLDHETADLLVLRLAPDLYDDEALGRMMIERLARERSHASEGSAPPWGFFFDRPDLALTAGDRARLLDAFETWSRARAAALPAVIHVPLADANRVHAETWCNGLREAGGDGLDVAVLSNVAELLPPDAAGVVWHGRDVLSGPDTVPGDDRAFALIGRPSHAGHRAFGQACGFDPAGLWREGATIDDGTDLRAAPYADLLVVARGVPVVAADGAVIRGATLRLAAARLGVTPTAPDAGDQPGLRAVVVVDGRVDQVDLWTQASPYEPMVLARTVPRADWDGASGTAPRALDIVGLALGQTRAGFAAAVRERIPDALEARAEAMAEPDLYGQALGFAAPDGRETFLALTAGDGDDAPVIALMRSVVRPVAEASFAGLREALIEKYGVPAEDSAQNLGWGLPALSLDQMRFCGGPSLIVNRPPQGVMMRLADASGAELGGYLTQPGYWTAFGWPKSKIDEPYLSQALGHCGPTVAAHMRDRGDGTVELIVWLVDQAAARKAAEAATAKGAARPVDLDL
jgi:hypothetical protein